MKKLIISLAAIVALCNVASAQTEKEEGKKAEKAQMIMSFTDKLEAQLVAGGLEEANVKKYAACYGADMDKTLSTEEVKIFIALQDVNTGKTEITEEMRHQAMQLRPKMAAMGHACNSLLNR